MVPHSDHIVERLLKDGSVSVAVISEDTWESAKCGEANNKIARSEVPAYRWKDSSLAADAVVETPTPPPRLIRWLRKREKLTSRYIA